MKFPNFDQILSNYYLIIIILKGKGTKWLKIFNLFEKYLSSYK